MFQYVHLLQAHFDKCDSFDITNVSLSSQLVVGWLDGVSETGCETMNAPLLEMALAVSALDITEFKAKTKNVMTRIIISNTCRMKLNCTARGAYVLLFFQLLPSFFVNFTVITNTTMPQMYKHTP